VIATLLGNRTAGATWLERILIRDRAAAREQVDRMLAWNIDRIVLVGCGSAFHAALTGEYIIESLAHIPVECEFASEFRYRNIPLDRDTLVFVISQSGETADTLAALRESQRKGHVTLGICNNVASTIARESDGGVYMHAGPEIGVAATKSFTSQLTIFALLGLLLGRIRHLSHSEGREIISSLEKLPDLVAKTGTPDANDSNKTSPRPSYLDERQNMSNILKYKFILSV
jgi:glucosamine--fructose-6-phosphate aminotransferase (isomerizing)